MKDMIDRVYFDTLQSQSKEVFLKSKFNIFIILGVVFSVIVGGGLLFYLLSYS